VELKENQKETAREKESLESQTPEDQQIKNSQQNLICPHCQVIYERGNFCIKCGSILVPQFSSPVKKEPKEGHEPDIEEKSIPLQTVREPLVEAPRKKLICPTCKIIYERGDSCIRCGLTLVAQLPLQEEEKSELPESSEVDFEPSPLANFEEKGLEDAERMKHKEVEVSPAPVIETKEEPSLVEPPEQQPTKGLTDDLDRRLSFSKKRKIDYRRLSLEVGSITILALAGGYFLWSVYSHMTKETGAETRRSKEVPGSVLLAPSMATNAAAPASMPKESDKRETEQKTNISSSPSNAMVADTLEIEKIKGMLENIRQANLRKNIDLFLSCYSTDFKDREVKKKATLDNWKKFDYLDLSYDLRNPSISGDTAKAKVEWLIRIFPTTGGKPQESRTTLDVLLKKEEGGWKIKEVRLVG
jgi:ketosteroid isomerase-like protein